MTERTDAPEDKPFKYRMVLKFDGFERVIEGEYPAPRSERATPAEDFVRCCRNLINGSKWDLTDSPQSFIQNIREFVEQYDSALKNAAPQTSDTARSETDSAPVLSSAVAATVCVGLPKGWDAATWGAWLRDRGNSFDPYVQGPIFNELADWIERRFER